MGMLLSGCKSVHMLQEITCCIPSPLVRAPVSSAQEKKNPWQHC